MILSRFCVLAGRALILFSAVLLAISPVTAHFWTFDRFLRGGQDFEMGLLSVLAVLCLVLLLADSFRESITLLIALRAWLSHAFHGGDLRRMGRTCAQGLRGDRLPYPGGSLGAFVLPLLI